MSTSATLLSGHEADEPIVLILREMGEATPHIRRRAHWLRLARAVEAALARQDAADVDRELLSISLGKDFLTVVRELRDERVMNKQRFEALWEYNRTRTEEIAALRQEIAGLRMELATFRATIAASRDEVSYGDHVTHVVASYQVAILKLEQGYTDLDRRITRLEQNADALADNR